MADRVADGDICTLSLNSSLDRTFEVDRILSGDISRVRSSHIHPGGKGLNVCRMATRLGGRARALIFLGGEAGRRIRRLLREEHVPCTVVATSGESRTIYNFVERRSGRVLRFNEPGPMVRPQEFRRLLDVLGRTPVSPRTAVSLSGSLPRGLPASTYRTVIGRLKKRTLLVALDADGECFREGLRAAPLLVKPNLWELERAVGRPLRRPGALEEACGRFLDRGIRLVAVTFGSRGALLFSREGILHGVPPPVKAGCSVGCGDAFLAGFLHVLVSGRKPADALALAVACGAAKASLPGTGMPTRAAVAALRTKVRVRTVEKIPRRLLAEDV